MLKKDIGQEIKKNPFCFISENMLHCVSLCVTSCKTNMPEMKIQWADNRLVKH